jgi:cytochrome b pre-mRNA-processing protein 3
MVGKSHAGTARVNRITCLDRNQSMPLASLFRRNRQRDAAIDLYGAIVEQARQPAFFARHGVPDTVDGRFELIALHAFLVLNRLKADRQQTAELGQALFDAMFADMDRGLREMGVGDLSVGRHVKGMAQSFYGRVVAYEHGLAADEAALAEALTRNLYGTVAPRADDAEALAAYMRQCVAALAVQPVDVFLTGQARFPAAPEA